MPSPVSRPPARACGSLRVALALLVLFVPSGAIAAELRLGIDGNYTFNSNYFSGDGNEQEANSFQLGPSVEIADQEGRFRYEVQFDGAYQAYADQDGVDAWESRLRARASYDLTDRTRIRLTNRFRDISNLRFGRQDIEVADTALDPNQDRYFRNELELELIHDLTELLELRVRGEHHWVDFEQNLDRNDSTAWQAAGELRYQLSTRHFVGAGASYTRQDFEEALSRIGSTGDFVSGYATWTWLVTDAITFTANGGPSWVRSDEDSVSRVFQTEFVGGRQNGEFRRAQFQNCGPSIGGQSFSSNCTLAPTSNDGPDLGGLLGFTVDPTTPTVGSDTQLTFFGGATLSGAFGDWNATASYQRRQSTTTGDGLASSLDRIFGELEYAPSTSRMSVFAAGSWDRRETLTDSTVIDFVLVDPGPGAGSDSAQRDPAQNAVTAVRSRNTRRDNFTVILGTRYRLEDTLSVVLDGRYRRTELDGANVNTPGIDTFFVVLSFEWDAPPIQL